MEIEQREDVLSPGSITVFVGVTFETPLTSLGHALSLNACPITHDRRRPAEAAHPRLPNSPLQIYSFPPDRFSHFGCFFFFFLINNMTAPVMMTRAPNIKDESDTKIHKQNLRMARPPHGVFGASTNRLISRAFQIIFYLLRNERSHPL